MPDIRVPSNEETAHHEAGHTVVQYRLSRWPDRVTLGTRVDENGVAILGGSLDGVSDTSDPSDMEARIVSLYAGGDAQRRYDARTGDDGCWDDEEKADDLLREWKWKTREDEFRARSRDMVERHWSEIVAVASELLGRGALDEEEVRLIADATAGTAAFDYGHDLATELAGYRRLREQGRVATAAAMRQHRARRPTRKKSER